MSAIFLGGDFITVSKNEDAEWTVMKPELFAAIMDFFASGQPVVFDSDDGSVPGASTVVCRSPQWFGAHIQACSKHKNLLYFTGLINSKKCFQAPTHNVIATWETNTTIYSNDLLLCFSTL